MPKKTNKFPKSRSLIRADLLTRMSDYVPYGEGKRIRGSLLDLISVYYTSLNRQPIQEASNNQLFLVAKRIHSNATKKLEQLTAQEIKVLHDLTDLAISQALTGVEYTQPMNSLENNQMDLFCQTKSTRTQNYHSQKSKLQDLNKRIKEELRKYSSDNLLNTEYRFISRVIVDLSGNHRFMSWYNQRRRLVES